MRRSVAVHTSAVGLALTLCALLLGLSRAHDALPGDTFQVARTAAAASAVAGAETPQGRKLPEPRQSRADAPHWLAVLPDLTGVEPALRAVRAASTATTLHDGRLAGAPGCRGPPTS